MTDLDEQLKLVRLQKEKIELERLISQQNRNNQIFKLLTTLCQWITNVFCSIFKALANFKKQLLILLSCLLLVAAVDAIYNVWKKRQEDLIRMQIDELVDKKCLGPLKTCEEKRTSGFISDIESIACFNTEDAARRCESKVRSEAYQSITSKN
jgi:hypothetical protein